MVNFATKKYFNMLMQAATTESLVRRLCVIDLTSLVVRFGRFIILVNFFITSLFVSKLSFFFAFYKKIHR